MKVLVLLALLGVTLAEKRYDGYQVLRMTPSNTKGIEFLQKASEMNVGVSLWTDLKSSGHPVDVMVAPGSKTLMKNKAKEMNIDFHVMIEDVQKLHEQNMFKNDVAKRMSSPHGKALDHSYYRTLSDIYAELDNFAAANDNMMVTDIGTTFEGRSIRMMRIGSGSSSEAVFFDCGIHAREWVSPATCLYIIDQLSDATDPDVQTLLADRDFYIVVSSNPDGYEYTWSDDRLWRKNREPNNGALCVGVDCNRNFDSNFGGNGASDAPCSDTYHGPSAFSTREAAALRDAISGINNVKAAYSIHSYSQLWLYPYGYTTVDADDDAEMKRVATVGVDAIRTVDNKSYSAGSIVDILYVASGGSIDYYYDALGVVYSYTIELRDTGLYGFELPADQILITGQETWAGLKAAIFAQN